MPKPLVIVGLSMCVAASTARFASAQQVLAPSTREIRDQIQRQQVPLAPPPAPVIAPPPVDCDPYLLREPRRLSHVDPQLTTVASCLRLIGGALVVDDAAEASTALNERLIRHRLGFKTLKKWIPDDRPPSTGSNLKGYFDARTASEQVERQLLKLLKKHDLYAQFSAILITGASLADASQPEPAGDAAADGANEEAEVDNDSNAVGTIVWQSRHFGDESIRTFDVSIGGRIGFQPVLNLVAPAEEDEGEPRPVAAVHQNAFAWTLGTQLNFPYRSINAEWGVFARTGSTTLMSLPKAVDGGSGSYLAFPLDNGAEKTAWIWEAGTEFNIFDTPLEQIHAEKGSTSPQFHLTLAWRHDGRFNGGVYDAYDAPQHRLLFRFALDAIKVVDRRQFGEPAKPFTFGFVVEHERSLATDGLRVPSATRFILRGDLNLLKALSPATAAAEEKPAAPAPEEWTVDLENPEKPVEPLVLGSKPASVVVTLVSVAGAEGSTAATLPMTVAKDSPSHIKLSSCAESALELKLVEDKLTLTPLKWDTCKVTGVVLRVALPE